MKWSSADIGELIRTARKSLHITQDELALTAGTGLRFIVDLERGKATCELGKALAVINTLGIEMNLTMPTERVAETQPMECD